MLRSSAALCAYTAILCGRLKIEAENVDCYVDSFLHLVEDEVAQTRLAAVRVLGRCLMLVSRVPLAKMDSVLSSTNLVVIIIVSACK